MQYKKVLPVIFLVLGSTCLFAQQKVTTAAASQVSVNDSAKTGAGKTGEKPSALIAGNLPSGPKVYNHIPLAGEKSYFGDKNDFVNDFTRKYLELHNRTLGSVQNVSATPFSVIDDVLEQKKMPKELKYIAVIESALNHNAVSRAGAVGTWQLMAATAKMLGLSVSRRDDERRDLYKSTNAATKYLDILYGELNDWLLVIAAYNSGPTPVEKAIQLTGSRNFWDIKQYLPQETQGYVLSFIATASIFENLNKFISLGSVPIDFKFGKDEDVPPPAPVAAKIDGKPVAPIVKKASTTITEDELKSMTMVRITDPIDLEYTALELGMDKNVLMRWNSDFQQFLDKKYPTPFYNLRLPKDKVQLFLQKKDQITKKSSSIFSMNK